MKIGIDISQVVYQGTGVAAYTENLITNLLKIDKKNEYVLFGSSLRLRSKLESFYNSHATVHGSKEKGIINSKNKKNYNNSQGKFFSFPLIFLECLWNKYHILPIETFTGKLDVFHSSDWLEPPAKCPKVTTIHDLAIFKYPETFAPRGGHNIVTNLKRKFEWVKKESKLIIAVSENTKKDIMELLGVPEERIRVVYEAVDEKFIIPKTKLQIEKIKKKYGVEGKYILAVGTIEPRKNLKRVIEAFFQLRGTEPVNLVIAGKYGWGHELDRDRVRDRVKILGYVPKEDLAGLYAGAECFVYPSLYEGFGLPVLEAMASGCPVVTSNVSSLPEIAGQAGVLVNPYDTQEIERGIQEALQNRKKLIELGRQHCHQFSWQKTALQTLKIYEEALGKS